MTRKSSEKMKTDGSYVFEKNFFSIEADKLWDYFDRNNKGLRDTYLFLRVIEQEHNDDSEFWCSANYVSRRSLLCESQVKKYLRILESLGLIERRREMLTEGEDFEDFTSLSHYTVHELTDKILEEAHKRKEYAYHSEL